MALFTWDKSREPVVGDQRTVKRFLLFPRNLHGEVRWLGVEKIHQEWVAYRVPLKGVCGSYPSHKWVNVEWAE